MKERMCVFVGQRGFFMADGLPSKSGTAVACRSAHEETVFLSRGTLQNQEVLFKALRKMRQAHADAVVVVPDAEVVSRAIPVPGNISSKQVALGLRHSLRGKLPGDPQTYSLNYYIPKLEQKRIFVSALPKEIVKGIESVFRELGLTLKAIVPLTSALSAGLSSGLTPTTVAPIAILDYQGDEISLGIGLGDFLVYSALFRSDIALPVPSREALDDVLSRWSQQMNRHFKSLSSDIPIPVSAIYLTGGWDKLGPLAEIRKKLGALLGVTVLSPSFPSEFAVESATAPETGYFAAAVSGMLVFNHSQGTFTNLRQDFGRHRAGPVFRLPPLPRGTAVAAAAVLALAGLVTYEIAGHHSLFHPRQAMVGTPVPGTPVTGLPPHFGGPPPVKAPLPISSALASLSSLTKNAIFFDNVTVEGGMITVKGACLEEGSLRHGMEELSKMPNIESVALESASREKENLKFTLLVKFRGGS